MIHHAINQQFWTVYVLLSSTNVREEIELIQNISNNAFIFA